jgi:archaellin
MKKIWLFFLINITLFGSQEYFAKVEPITTYKVKSSVSGQVTYVNSALEATELKKSELIVKIDDAVNKIDLKQSKIKLVNLQKIQSLEQENLERFQKVSSKSKFDKDNQRIKILNVVSTISDLKTRIATLEDTIKNKNLYEANRYIYNIAVEQGDYVNPGTHLYTAMDRSKGKLVVYIPIDQADTIKQKDIYIDGEKTDLKISKLYTVADEQYISSYKCELHLPNPTSFSSLKKIEFK